MIWRRVVASITISNCITYGSITIISYRSTKLRGVKDMISAIGKIRRCNMINAQLKYKLDCVYNKMLL